MGGGRGYARAGSPAGFAARLRGLARQSRAWGHVFGYARVGSCRGQAVMAMHRLARGQSLHRTDGGRACRLGCGHVGGSWRRRWVRQGAVVEPRRTAVMARWRLGLPRPCPDSVVA
ncbi:hypothetical protein E2562_016752 [Oryza meyeriana var. granulata]|uniref:Uncharacterized protein n=1 Tax=Oryza meyeriana var. granulata TaxID=110450 RepID=A0A6G1BLG7_9ORYZ|nr:hypothetical protein E2562_016752 [Oryza meyeriana var. granulata]